MVKVHPNVVAMPAAAERAAAEGKAEEATTLTGWREQGAAVLLQGGHGIRRQWRPGLPCRQGGGRAHGQWTLWGSHLHCAAQAPQHVCGAVAHPSRQGGGAASHHETRW
ncbi:unnamed protein product [Urochloa humidicola]